MKAFAQFIIKNRWWVIGTWLIAAILIVALSPSLSSIESTDQSSFLPSSYESVQAGAIAKQLSGQSDAPTDIVVFKNTAGTSLSDTDLSKITSIIASLNADKLDHVLAVATTPQQIAPNHTAQLATVVYTGGPEDAATINAVKGVRDDLTKLTQGSTISAGLTGGEAISYDTQDSANRALAIVSIGTLLLVLFLPALIFGSPLAGLLPLFSVGVVFAIANSLIAIAGHMFGFKLNQQLTVLFTVVLFGIGTDYILFLLFRYRERLRTGDFTPQAVAFALSRAGEAILSAALVVIASFAALFFAQFGIFSSLAPGLIISVAVMLVAALTLVPALVAVLGPIVFWPSKSWKAKVEKAGFSKRVGGLVEKRPGLVTSVVVVLLVAFAVFALSFKSDFSSFSSPPSGTLSATAYDQLTQSFPAGVLTPTQVYLSSTSTITMATVTDVATKLGTVTGVSAAYPGTISADGKIGEVTLILKDDPYSKAALDAVTGPIREAAHSFNSSTMNVYVGGASSAIADVRDVTNRDLSVIFPIAAAFIFLILAVLLRSIVAPLVLLACVSLGYAATLGATVLIFQYAKGDAGLISFIPLFMYIFVVAIGTDYNILTITRLREEVKEGLNPREAANMTIEHSSATVASAGLILAATFGSLLLGGVSFLLQMGASIAIGVAISSFIIAPFLIPSISALIGYVIWWPGHKPEGE